MNLLKGPEGFELAEVALNAGTAGWDIEWVPAWVRLSARVEKPVDAILIQKDGDYTGLIHFVETDQVAAA